MRFSCSTFDLRRAIDLAGRAPPAIGQTPYLRLTAAGSRLAVTAGAPTLQITANSPAEVKDAGAIALPARLLSDVLRVTVSDEVSADLRARTNDLVLRCGEDETTLRAFDPELLAIASPITGGLRLLLPQEQLARAIDEVVFVSIPDASSAPSGIQIECDGAIFRATAASRERAGWSEVSLEVEQTPFAVLVPPRALTELARFPLMDDESSVEIVVDRGRAVDFVTSVATLRTGVVAASLPNVAARVPTGWESRGRCNRAEFLREVELATLFAAQEARPVTLELRAGLIAVGASSGEVGGHAGRVRASIEGREARVSLHGEHVAQVLGALRDEEVIFEVSKEPRPVVIRAPERPGFLHLMGPLAIEP